MIDQIFNKYKTKFSVLNSLKIVKPNVQKVAVYINIEMILKSVFTDRVNKYMLNTNGKNDVCISIISSVLNLAQHYRWYFVKMGYNCEAFIYWNYPIGKYLNYIHNKNYRSYFNNKIYHSNQCIFLNQCLENSFRTIKMIALRMNGINIVTNDVVESSLIPYVIYNDYYHGDNSIQHIIVSNDKYDFQYANKGFSIIVPRQDDTIIVTSENVIDVLKKSFSIKTDDTISANHLSFGLSIIGSKYRNINKIANVGFGYVIKVLNQSIDKMLITENTIDVHTLSGLISPKYKCEFISNFNCIDLDAQYNVVSPTIIHEILSCIHDKYDDNALDMINEKFFQNHPLMTFHNHKQELYTYY